MAHPAAVWAFRLATTAMPVLTALEPQLQAHSIDPWALGAAAVGSVVIAISHFGIASSDPIVTQP